MNINFLLFINCVLNFVGSIVVVDNRDFCRFKLWFVLTVDLFIIVGWLWNLLFDLDDESVSSRASVLVQLVSGDDDEFSFSS